jgi:hypothetical protein
VLGFHKGQFWLFLIGGEKSHLYWSLLTGLEKDQENLPSKAGRFREGHNGGQAIECLALYDSEFTWQVASAGMNKREG